VQCSRDPSPRKTHRNSSEDGHGWRQNSRLRSCELGKDVSRVVQCDNRFAQSRLRDQCLKILGEHVRCVRSVWLKICLLGKKQEMNIEVLWSPWLVIIDLAERHDIVYIYCPVKIFRRPFLLPQPAYETLSCCAGSSRLRTLWASWLDSECRCRFDISMEFNLRVDKLALPSHAAPKAPAPRRKVLHDKRFETPSGSKCWLDSTKPAHTRLISS
jgi:hypothetical protein